MSTKIQWTDETWNPSVGCSKVSTGCENCYAERMARRQIAMGNKQYKGTVDERGKWTGKTNLVESQLAKPLRWRKPRKVFVCSMGDLFHESVPDESIEEVFAVMALADKHTFQVLTKRPDRMRAFLADDGDRYHWAMIEGHAQRIHHMRTGEDPSMWLAVHGPLPNVWLGTTVENQAAADERIPHLLSTPAAVRFVSCEPLVGAVDLSGYMDEGWFYNEEPLDGPLDWVIAGGESGPGARPMHPDWARSLRDQCQAAGVPFFFKQHGEWLTYYDRDNEDPDWRRCPSPESPKERYLNLAGGWGFHGDRVVAVRRVGKQQAGNGLDNRTWEEMPG